jgi:hypothetical protein
MLGAILEGEGAKGIPQDPGRVPSSEVDRQKGAEGGNDGETQEPK